MRVTALKSVDLPTFGNPTIPALSISADGTAIAQPLQLLEDDLCIVQKFVGHDGANGQANSLRICYGKWLLTALIAMTI